MVHNPFVHFFEGFVHFFHLGFYKKVNTKVNKKVGSDLEVCDFCSLVHFFFKKNYINKKIPKKSPYKSFSKIKVKSEQNLFTPLLQHFQNDRRY